MDKLTAWRQLVDGCASIAAEQLVRGAREFLNSDHAPQAVAFGWTELELFGLHRGDLAVAARRADALGLIPGNILSTNHTYQIVRIEATRAELRTNGGATLYHSRRLSGADLAVPFWEHAALTCEQGPGERRAGRRID